MSYFLFGSFRTTYDEELVQQVKLYGSNNDIYIWFNEEITFYKEIQRMLEEQESEGDIIFAITSKNQPHNSNDVLFPFDKVDNEVLFADESRSIYKKYCEENLDILFECLNTLIQLLGIRQLEIFVVEGYDVTFQKKICDLDAVKIDLLCQIENKVFIDSCIYYISLI